MLNLKLAFKNIFRNKRRTLLTLFALIIGNIGILLFLGYMNASFYFMRESAIKDRVSHVQIYKKGYSEKGSIEPNKYMINKNSFRKIKEILSKEKMVRVVTAKQVWSVLISWEKKRVNSGFRGIYFQHYGILTYFFSTHILHRASRMSH